MAFSVDDFKAKASAGGGFAMGGLYRVFLPPLEEGGDETAEGLSILCKTANIPGVQVTSLERPMGPLNEKIANGFAVDDASLSFYCLNDMGAWRYFNAWRRLAYDPETNEIGYLEEYGKPVVVQLLKKTAALPLYRRDIYDTSSLPRAVTRRLPQIGPIDLARGEINVAAILSEEVALTVVLDRAWPSTMQAMELSNETELMEVSVQLSYKNWRIRDGGGFDVTDDALDILSLARGILG